MRIGLSIDEFGDWGGEAGVDEEGPGAFPAQAGYSVTPVWDFCPPGYVSLETRRERPYSAVRQ